MDLITYRRAEGISQAELASAMTAAGFPCTQGLISQWEKGLVLLTAERCIQIEQVTDGKVTRLDLRPDLFGALPKIDLQAEPDAGDVPKARVA